MQDNKVILTKTFKLGGGRLFTYYCLKYEVTVFGQIRVYLIVWSKEALRSWLLSLQKLAHVTPLLWARSNLLRH